ncbi:serine/threonine-protein kinase [Zhongshania sp. BJYM1]|uniref:serine/threonine-protein kinase n=1 Tax=Zhongshania aquatica TaxID=2965069 RepID=UPI0022B54B37|nr:protein kinase [Marortus sp. BJYM1]
MTDNDKTRVLDGDGSSPKENTELDESLFDLDDSLACGDSSLIVDNITELPESTDEQLIDVSFDQPEADIDLVDDDATEVSVYASKLGDTSFGAEDATVVTVASNNDATTLYNPKDTLSSAGAGGGTGFQVGDLLKDRFRLEKMLGEGGMGAVFLAVDQRKIEARHHDPYVAIKLISGDFSQDPLAYISLQRETDKSQKLAHPNVITVYDFDRDGDVFFMTMEALKGQTLDELIKSQTLTPAQNVELINAMSQGLAYAHHRNIVHSDVKPQNIFVTEAGVLKVLDFGIARALASVEGAVPDEIDEVVGLTPAYASCDMFEGADPDPADDVYAIGIIAYQLFTGKHPFDRKKATVARDAGMQPKRIKGIPYYQWKAIAKALRFERTERWQNADQFYRQFSGAGRMARHLSIALLTMALAFGGYLSFYTPESGPDIPFEELSPVVQQKVLDNLGEADQAMKFSDFNGALFYLDRAYDLHPRNPDVMEKLNVVVDKIVDALAVADTENGRELGLQQLSEIMKYDSLAQNPTLLALKKKLEAGGE